MKHEHVLYSQLTIKYKKKLITNVHFHLVFMKLFQKAFWRQQYYEKKKLRVEM